MEKELRLPLRVVFYREEGRCIAHCLELDLVGDGESREEAVKQLCVAIGSQIEASLKYNNMYNLFTPADGRFFAMFAQGRDVAVGEICLKRNAAFRIESVEGREYCDSGACTAFA